MLFGFSTLAAYVRRGVRTLIQSSDTTRGDDALSFTATHLISQLAARQRLPSDVPTASGRQVRSAHTGKLRMNPTLVTRLNIEHPPL